MEEEEEEEWKGDHGKNVWSESEEEDGGDDSELDDFEVSGPWWFVRLWRVDVCRFCPYCVTARYPIRYVALLMISRPLLSAASCVAPQCYLFLLAHALPLLSPLLHLPASRRLILTLPRTPIARPALPPRALLQLLSPQPPSPPLKLARESGRARWRGGHLTHSHPAPSKRGRASAEQTRAGRAAASTASTAADLWRLRMTRHKPPAQLLSRRGRERPIRSGGACQQLTSTAWVRVGRRGRQRERRKGRRSWWTRKQGSGGVTA